MKNLFIRIGINIEGRIESEFCEDYETSFVVGCETLETVASRPDVLLFLGFQVIQA
jgi:hypothetical protein